MTLDNPEYKEQADKIVATVQRIKKAIMENGFGTMTVVLLLTELMKLTQVAGSFMQLPTTERDEFFAEVFDAAIGTEPNALINKVSIFEGEALERMSDGMKAAVVAYFNRQLPAAPIG